jgi:hypothetical protein
MIIKNTIIVINFLLSLWLGGPHLVYLILKAKIQIQLPSNVVFFYFDCIFIKNDTRNNYFSNIW